MRCNWFILGLLLLQGLSCKKEDQLPKATESGANTFGCKIEGRLYVPQRSTNFGSMPPLLTYYNNTGRYFELSVSENPDNSDNRLQRHFHLEVQNLTVGANNLNEINTGVVSISQYNQPDQTYTQRKPLVVY